MAGCVDSMFPTAVVVLREHGMLLAPASGSSLTLQRLEGAFNVIVHKRQDEIDVHETSYSFCFAQAQMDEDVRTELTRHAGLCSSFAGAAQCLGKSAHEYTAAACSCRPPSSDA